MLLTAYNEEQHNRTLRNEGREEGRREGRAEGISLVSELYRRLIEDGREEDMKRAVLDKEYCEELLKVYNFT